RMRRAPTTPRIKRPTGAGSGARTSSRGAVAIMDLRPIHELPKSFIRRWIFSTDHKVIAKQFLFTGIFFLGFGGLMAMLIRWQWAYPGEAVPVVGNVLFPRSGGAIGPAAYNSLFTNHGLIMIFWAITPILIGAF